MIYIIKQEGLYQNKVNSSLVFTCNCKMGYSSGVNRNNRIVFHFSIIPCRKPFRYSTIESIHMTSRQPSQNNKTAAMLVVQTSPVGVEFFSYANAFFCSKKICTDAGHVSENTLLHPLNRILSLFQPKHFTVCHFIIPPSKRAIFQLEISVIQSHYISAAPDSLLGNPSV